MVSFISKIIAYFKNRKSIALIGKVNSYITVLHRKYSSLSLNAQDSNEKVRYVPRSHFESLLKSFDSYRAYIEGESPFLISPTVEEQYISLKPWLTKLPEYDGLLQKFHSLKIVFTEAFIDVEKRSKEMEELVRHYNTKLHLFFDELKVLQQDYISESVKNGFVKRHQELYLFYKDADPDELEDSLAISFIDIMKNVDNHVSTWNSEYIQRELESNKQFFDDIDGKSLDQQQRIAVLTDEDNNLVLAGAGSGKTLTIAGKVNFLIKRKKVSPEDILLISFTNKAAGEMHERIVQKLGVNVDVKTFHKLGMGIIARHSEQKPDVLNEMKPIVQEFFKTEVYSNPVLLGKIVTFFGMYLNIPKDLEEFNSLGEYHEHTKSFDFETLKGKLQKVTQNLQTIKGETVKSLEETLIANFLFLNGIEYEYEKDYEFPTATQYHRQYKPDFYLPEYGIYIEHFGVTEDMRTPWLSPIEEKKYLEGIVWKRKLHQDYKTTLIESYSYYNKNGVLFKMLEENLRSHGVVFKKIDLKSIYEVIRNHGRDQHFEEYIKLICSFINLFKSNGYNQEHFALLLEENRKLNCNNAFMRERNELFLTLVEPIYVYYQSLLKKRNQIDFNDMINIATDIARQASTSFSYKYIIIDEYQDISNSRFQLIKAIKDKTNAKVMCVGDDWQSIYRFAGSDVQLFTRFGEFFGKFELLRIEKTYRNSQQLIDIAGSFVMKNQNQLKKNLISGKTNTQPIRIIGYNQNMVEALRTTLQEILTKYGNNQSIMLLGRNNFDINFLKEVPGFRVIERNQEVKIQFEDNKSLKLFFMTTHKSKGLEADHVILINAKNDLLGFPNRISDDPVLSWVLTDQDSYPFAEERRLFYVALTRTKGNLYILAPEKDPSIFVNELIKEYKIPFETQLIKNPIANNPKCLKCQTGILVERKNDRQQRFLGCSNYPRCDQTYNDVRILNNQIFCNRCNGYMVKRSGKWGEFLGCSNYPLCDNTINFCQNRANRKKWS